MTHESLSDHNLLADFIRPAIFAKSTNCFICHAMLAIFTIAKSTQIGMNTSPLLARLRLQRCLCFWLKAFGKAEDPCSPITKKLVRLPLQSSRSKSPTRPCKHTHALARAYLGESMREREHVCAYSEGASFLTCVCFSICV